MLRYFGNFINSLEIQECSEFEKPRYFDFMK